MKVTLIKPFGSHEVGSVVTMHPINARKFFEAGVCEGMNDIDQQYLRGEIDILGRRVEFQAGSPATEVAITMPIKGGKRGPETKVNSGRARGGRRRKQA